MYFITLNYSTATPTFTDAVIQPDPTWNNVAVSKDGTKIAANDGTDTLWVYSFSLSKWKSFKLYNPTFSGVSAGAVQYSDALEWDHFGTSVVYDAYNKISGQGNATFEYWDVGIVDVWSNQTSNFLAAPKIEKLFSDLPEGTSIADPTFSKNSPYIIAFDYIDKSVTPIEYYVLASNTQTGDVTAAAGGIYQNNTYGYPSFSKTDNRILFTNEDAAGASRLGIVTLSATSKLEPSTTAPTIFKMDAALGNWFSSGTRILNVVGELEKTAIQVSPNPFTDNVSVSIASETAENGKIEVIDLLGRIVQMTPLSILVGKNTVSLDTHTLEAGTYLLKISVGEKSRTSKIVKF